MMQSSPLYSLLVALALPPLNLLLIGLLGLLLVEFKLRLGRRLLVLSLGGLWLFSTPIVASKLMESLMPPPQVLTGKEADAIVILGGGRIKNSVEYGGDTEKNYTLERLRYGAHLANTLKKPVLVTGGSVESNRIPEGELMRDILQNEFHVPVRWVEDRSRNTRENAMFSAELLAKSGIKRIYLVTHAWHLARAMPEFQHANLTVIPAGTGYRMAGGLEFNDFIPNAQALLNSYLACHEWVGMLWYRLNK